MLIEGLMYRIRDKIDKILLSYPVLDFYGLQHLHGNLRALKTLPQFLAANYLDYRRSLLSCLNVLIIVAVEVGPRGG
jgi:hypothetical protein